MFGPVFNSNAPSLLKITDKHNKIYGTTMMLVAIVNAVISHSLTSNDTGAGMKKLHEYASMFKIVLKTIETENSPSFEATCMVLSKCHCCLLTGSSFS